MTVQRNAAWVKAATPQQTVDALERGELHSYMSSDAEIADSFEDSKIVQRDATWVANASVEDIERASAAGELVEYAGGHVNDLGNPVTTKPGATS